MNKLVIIGVGLILAATFGFAYIYITYQVIIKEPLTRFDCKAQEYAGGMLILYDPAYPGDCPELVEYYKGLGYTATVKAAARQTIVELTR